MLKSKSIDIQVFYILIFAIFIGYSIQTTNFDGNTRIDSKINFYNNVLKTQSENNLIEIVKKNSELYLSSKDEIPVSTKFLTFSHKYLFTGCTIIFNELKFNSFKLFS